LLSNRVVMAPLTRGRALNPGHVPNSLMREYYEQRSTAGLIITEGTWVSEDGKGWIGAPGIYNSAQGNAWRKITDAVMPKAAASSRSCGIRERFPTLRFFLTGVSRSLHQRSIRNKWFMSPMGRR